MKSNRFLRRLNPPRTLSKPRQEIEYTPTDENTQPKYQLGPINDHAQDVNSWPKH